LHSTKAAGCTRYQGGGVVKSPIRKMGEQKVGRGTRFKGGGVRAGTKLKDRMKERLLVDKAEMKKRKGKMVKGQADTVKALPCAAEGDDQEK